MLAKVEQSKPLDEIPHVQLRTVFRALSEWRAGSQSRIGVIMKAYSSGAYALIK